MLKAYKIPVALLLIMTMPYAGIAAGPPLKSEMNNPLAITLVVVIVGLLIAIGGLAYVVLTAAQLYLQRFKEEKLEKQQAQALLAKGATLILLCMLGSTAFAQEAPANAGTTEQVINTIGGLSKLSFYTLISVIALELLVIFVLLFNLKILLSKEKQVAAAVETEVAVQKESAWKRWWIKINSFRSMQEEADIALDHNYDGIRELDNKLPPWWLYGFYITIFFAIVYLWRFHVSHSAPSTIEEYNIAMAKAEVEKEAYLANAANNVDENTVKLLTDAASLEGGKKIFTSVCAACHAADGGGGVGPNLTDAFWLHGGTIKDVFKSVKYGWPEKGMKSWKDDFSPVQLAQLASYIKSLQGSKPATPKEPQGEPFHESPANKSPADSAAISLK